MRRRKKAVQLALIDMPATPLAFCRRCGKKISSKVALFIGMGRQCAKLAGISGPMKQADIQEVL